MELSKSQVNTNQPAWQDYLPFMQQFAGQDFPTCDQLNAMLKPGLCSEGGFEIRFTPSEQLADEPYEQRIFHSGLVSTRANNWHDFFNALVWARFPAIKTAMNACHKQAWTEQKDGSRGQVRDALTLFDECGVIVFSSNPTILKALSERRWIDAFLHHSFQADVGLSICGHAMLEKYLSPYKSMTAKALLIHIDPDFMRFAHEDKLVRLDRFIANGLAGGRILTKPACLSPLPLAGVPGWWAQSEQRDETFYQDLQVFRPAPANLTPAPVIKMQ